MKITKLQIAVLAFSLLLLGCGQSGGGDSAADRSAVGLSDFTSAPEVENAYTVVVYLPDVSKTTTTTIYDNLYTNLTSAASQAKLPISRVLLTTVSPTINGVFNIDSNTSSFAVTFLNKLAAFNKINPSKAIQVIAFPDVEAQSPWLDWVVPSQYLSIPSCKLSQTTQDQSQKAMLLSICWGSAVNKFVGSKIISGVAYDQQENWLASTAPDTHITWVYEQAHNDQLLSGWTSANGIAANAGKIDLNFIEVYDMSLGGFPYYDTIALETVHKVILGQGVCVDNFCSYDKGNAVKNNNPLTYFFPGTQYTFGSGSGGTGAIGANIYQCAISNTSDLLTANSCTDAYTSNVDTTQTPSVQIMQAMNYLWGAPSKQLPTKSHYGAGGPLGGNVIYLFSSQYAGPQKSYYASSTITNKTQCADPLAPPNACSCIATLYNPHAFCGSENGFGTWGKYYSEFVNFTNLFLSTQGGGNCPGQSCSAGIYMYDFIPQSWYSQ